MSVTFLIKMWFWWCRSGACWWWYVWECS